MVPAVWPFSCWAIARMMLNQSIGSSVMKGSCSAGSTPALWHTKVMYLLVALPSEGGAQREMMPWMVFSLYFLSIVSAG